MYNEIRNNRTMSTERNNLLNLLFPNGYPCQWNHNQFFTDYLSKLGSYKVEDLLKEPQRLKDEKSTIQEQTQDLAVTNYKTFIETAECSRDLSTHFTTIENKIGDLLVDIPDFEHEIKEFTNKTSGINNQRKLNSLTLTRSAQLLGILELPQLMNSFINDELYEDALELASYVRKLYNKHPDVPIFKNIVDDVNQAWSLMLHHLLCHLRKDLTLPKCLQIVGHLRRMEEFSELTLRLKFLQARDAWLQHCLNSIPRTDVNDYLAKTVEVTRVNMFNIITQYKAIFNEDDQSQSGATKSDTVNPNVIFYSWISDKIHELLTTLELNLQYCSSVESLIDQCMYFGQSFSKVGCDFRPLLVPIFTKQISNNFCSSISRAVNNFEHNIEKFTLINKNHPNIPWRTKHEDPLQPPDSLLEFYPLAEYLNNVLTALNDLRLYAPIAVIPDIVSSLENSLTFIAKSILHLYMQEQQAFTSNSKDAFTRLCMSFSDDLVPYLQKCIHIIYPPSQVASTLGVNIHNLQQEKITFLNKNAIVEPIKHLLPNKVEISVLNVEDRSDNVNKDVENVEVEIKNPEE